MKLFYDTPCGGCPRDAACYDLDCKRWRQQFLAAWDSFRDYPRREYRRMAKESGREVFRYAHPDEIRAYLKNGPCPRCPGEKTCRVPCPAYWRWWDARMEKYKLSITNYE